MTTVRGPVPVEVRPATSPDGETMVLLQLPDGYLLTTPSGARDVAARLLSVAGEVEDL